MQTQLVAAEMPHHRRVLGQTAIQRGEIADIVHTFFEASDEARREADPFDPRRRISAARKKCSWAAVGVSI